MKQQALKSLAYNLLSLLGRVNRWRLERDKVLWHEFSDLKTAAQIKEMRIGLILRVRQRAKTGTKAYVKWIETEQIDAVWIPNQQLHVGDIRAFAGCHGHGPHHSERVFYIEGVGPVIGKRLYKAWKRHEKRCRQNWLEPS